MKFLISEWTANHKGGLMELTNPQENIYIFQRCRCDSLTCPQKPDHKSEMYVTVAAKQIFRASCVNGNMRTGLLKLKAQILLPFSPFLQKHSVVF